MTGYSLLHPRKTAQLGLTCYLEQVGKGGRGTERKGVRAWRTKGSNTTWVRSANQHIEGAHYAPSTPVDKQAAAP